MIDRNPLILIFAFLFAVAGPTAVADSATGHLLVGFPSGEKMLLGYLYRPQGKGPFPGIIFHHSHQKSLVGFDAGEWRVMADLFTSHGYMLFVPDRHPDLAEDEPDKGHPLKRHEKIHRDTLAALRWFKTQPDVDTNRIAVAGQFSGAVQTLYQAEQLTGVRALIAFSPANKAWDNDTFVREALTRSVQKATIPIFLIFSENQNLKPAEVLGRELQQKGKPNRLKIYPAPPGAKLLSDFALRQTSIWSDDFLDFLRETLK